MADIKNLPADLQGLPSFPCNGSRYYFKSLSDGTKQLVAQIFGKSHFIMRYPAGTTVDVIPANTVDSAAIIDGSVQDDDLSEGVRKKMTNTYDESNETLTLGSLNVVGASTQPSAPSAPIG